MLETLLTGGLGLAVKGFDLLTDYLRERKEKKQKQVTLEKLQLKIDDMEKRWNDAVQKLQNAPLSKELKTVDLETEKPNIKLPDWMNPPKSGGSFNF